MDSGIAGGNGDAYLQANWAFHSQIYRCAPGDILLSAIEGLWLRMGPYFRLLSTERSHLENAMAIHRDIVAALKSDDVPAARLGIIADIEAATRDLDAWLASHPS